jgi:tetratricopeptide (TPR) repeat protein
VEELNAALIDCNESLRLKPDVANTIDSRALIQFKLGEFDKAIADYDLALKLNPKLAGALYGRGLAKQKKGDATADADIAAAKAIQSDIAEKLERYGLK